MKTLPFANALTLVAGLVYVVCALGIAFARDAYVTVVNSFFHGIDIASLATKEMTLATTLSGFIVTLVTAWVLGYIFAHCYNWCAKNLAK